MKHRDEQGLVKDDVEMVCLAFEIGIRRKLVVPLRMLASNPAVAFEQRHVGLLANL